MAPAARAVALDRAQAHEEIRAALKVAPARERVAVPAMASGDLRVGALAGTRLKG